MNGKKLFWKKINQNNTNKIIIEHKKNNLWLKITAKKIATINIEIPKPTKRSTKRKISAFEKETLFLT